MEKRSKMIALFESYLDQVIDLNTRIKNHGEKL